jgi:hypothetical protein
MEDTGFQLMSDPPKKMRPEKRIKEAKCPKSMEATARFYANITPPATTNETKYRHGWWEKTREKVRNAMIRTCVNVFTLNRYDECGSECTVEYSKEANRHRVRANYCRSRHCQACMKAKGNKIAANLHNKLKAQGPRQYRFITLTVKHSDAPLAEQIRRLYASCKKLRHSKCWKETQKGGAITLEVKWKPETRKWHPHLHIISEGYYLNKERLSAAWHHATGDSFIADIRSLNSARDTAYYVAKYVTKGTNAEVWDDINAATEWITATKGVRVCATFGTWRGFALLQNPEDVTDWKPVGKLDTIIDEAKKGQPWAMAIIASLRPPGATDGPDKKRGKPK